MIKAKVSKIMMWPARKINLGNYSTADLSAGIEMVFDTPVEADSNEVKEALDTARQIVRDELKRQYEPYREIKVNKNK